MTKTVMPTVYLETTIVSYLVGRPSRDAIVRGHQATTIEWWTHCLPSVIPIISEAVMLEASRGDSALAEKRIKLLAGFKSYPISRKAQHLAGVYVSRGLVPESMVFDALHLAIASVHGIDYLLTWNCRHLAAAPVRRRVADINSGEGYATPVLCTPEELMEV